MEVSISAAVEKLSEMILAKLRVLHYSLVL